MKSPEQVLDETMLQKGIRIGWIPDTKQAVIKAMENYLEEQWLPLSESPNDSSYHLVSWELPNPDETKQNIKGVTVGIFDKIIEMKKVGFTKKEIDEYIKRITGK